MMTALLSVEDLRTHYLTRTGVVPAVDGVSISVEPGEVIGIVGESGCGKSTLARSILSLIDRSYTRIVDGQVIFDGRDLLDLAPHELNRVRGKEISMIFQNPQTALNPVYTVGWQISEALRTHQPKQSRREMRTQVLDLLRQVGIPAPEERIDAYPHQLSGGMQQRVGIAIALACRPMLLIADEPTTALDVTIQAQILELVRQINREHHMAMILVSHNLGVVAQLCTRTYVMYGGVVVEEATTDELFESPKHPYTQGLLRAIPQIGDLQDELETIPGRVPRLTGEVGHCRFVDRCQMAMDQCREAEPPLIALTEGRQVRCWLYPEDQGQDERGDDERVG